MDTTRVTACRTRMRDDGSATVEMVIAAPVLLLLLLLIVAGGVWVHAAHCAQAAADRAVEVARAYQSSATAGQAAGAETISALASAIISDPTVSVSRTATTVTAVVTGHVSGIVPGMSWTVRAEAAGPVERFVPETDSTAAPSLPVEGRQP